MKRQRIQGLSALAAAILLALSLNGRAADDRVFESRADAEAEAARQTREGQPAEIQAVPVKTDLVHVELLYYQTRAAAELAAEKLRQNGIDAYVMLPRERFGFAIHAGSFTRQSGADQRVAALRELGFINLRERSLPGRIIAYRIVPGRAVAAQPDTPASTSPTPPLTPTPASQPTEMSFGDASAVTESGEVMNFGSSDAPSGGSADIPAGRDDLEFHLDQLRLEAGFLTGDNPVDGSDNAHLTATFKWHVSPHFDLQLGARADAYDQNGDPGFHAGDGDYDESFLRFRSDSTRLTLGTQTVIWGRVDELSPTNLLLRQDLSRYTLDGLSNRYRAQPAVRFELFDGAHKFEALVLPTFVRAVLPETDSIWNPVNRSEGRIQGTETNPLMAYLVQNGSVDNDFHDGDKLGGGLRYSHSGQGLDFGLTAIRGRATLPYYRLNPAVRDALLMGAPPPLALAGSSGSTFQAEYPKTDLAGADIAFTAFDATWRGELVYTSDNPVTTNTLAFDTVPALSWAAGVELYPGDGNNRLTLQLNGRHLRTSEAIGDPKNLYSISGELENGFAQDTWRLRTRLFSNLTGGKHDLYLNPELAWLKWEPSEFYLGLHLFSGNEALPNGFHADDDMVVIGWRSQF